MENMFSINSRQKNSWRLFVFVTILAIAALRPTTSSAHQTPNTLVFLDASPNRVALELQMPLSELELAFGNNISKNPETLIERFGPQLKEYLKAHIHAYSKKTAPWQVEVESLRMDKGKYIENGIDYWELVAYVVIIPQPGEGTRKFMLDYDVIMHQVINHAALLSIRSDWETGNLNTSSAEAMVISWNTRDNVIYPLEINLQQGSWFKGFKSMFALGMQHIKEGTDHLLFLIVLLLPATLLTNGRQWGKFGGTKYSILRLLKIVTSFTIGHSITLLIGALGWLRLPAQPVEILIAFSILVSAIHAIKPIFPGKEMYVAAGFGLIHGLAFASILANLKLGAGMLVLSIFGFNLGIEVMQLFVVLITIPWLILLSQTPVYKYVRVGGAVISGMVAIAWILERATQTPNFVSAFVNKAAEQAAWAILVLAVLALVSISLKRVVARST
ncbi:HupE/UreJ family protein [Mucilaginibacter sp. BJC16-A38]|uniref:HupE/UreJ family protein n=1 Tax=Mucilaginibacter phenanthrenivorans TaxID=1234842 RepID=UPI00215838DA|nr:HupE/UreJ family protein [Mucilaginibacter phenanthrenivorans]MCR8558785.1 HupE/UreJ family protein [Mucilaginibacter phenanthrenivorans]